MPDRSGRDLCPKEKPQGLPVLGALRSGPRSGLTGQNHPQRPRFVSGRVSGQVDAGGQLPSVLVSPVETELALPGRTSKIDQPPNEPSGGIEDLKTPRTNASPVHDDATGAARRIRVRNQGDGRWRVGREDRRRDGPPDPTMIDHPCETRQESDAPEVCRIRADPPRVDGRHLGPSVDVEIPIRSTVGRAPDPSGARIDVSALMGANYRKGYHN